MFLFYQKKNDILCDIFQPVSSITEVLTTIALCIWDNLTYSLIMALLIVIITTIIVIYKIISY